MFTFCVLGHNESSTVLYALAMAKRAANAEDTVVFVDSASEDDSATLASDAGYPVVSAPIGKGRAVRSALAAAGTPWVCLVDADIEKADRNIAHTLAERARLDDTDMIVGDFDEPGSGSILSNTWAIYEPLTSALFPEIAGMYGSKPLSGFRALRTGLDLPDIPDDFGVEAYLNVAVPLRARRASTTPIGSYGGPFRYKPTMGIEIARPILDTATEMGRLSTRQRPEWDAWVAGVVDVVGTYRGHSAQRDEYLARLRQAVSRPLPPTGV